MLSHPAPEEPAEASALRGRIFSDLDRLAFALEMEAADRIRQGDDAGAERTQQQRLGVRLAQRLVTGIWADEVDARIRRWADEYESRLGMVA